VGSRYSETFRIRCCDVDPAGCWKLRSVLDCLQETASAHAERIGVGFEEMVKNRHLAWVLARLRIRFLRQASYGMTMSVETFPNGFDRLFTLRQFIGRDEKGAIFLEGSSQWLAVSLEHRRPERPARAGFDFENEEAASFFPDLGKIEPPEAMRELFSVSVENSRLDLNGHMNNAEYAALVQDALGLLIPDASVKLSEVQLNFLSEQKKGARLRIFGALTQDGFSVAGLAENGEAAFQAEGKR